MQIGRVLTVAAVATLPCTLAAQNVPGVDVWMPRPAQTLVPEVMVPAHVVADAQAYIVVFRVTTDNRIIVLSPRTPYGGYRVPKGGLRSKGVDVSFHTEPTNGVGHLFAAASYIPFDFSRFRAGANWDVNKLDTPPPGDPQQVADWFLKRIVPSAETPYSINDVAYYVGVVPPMDDSSMVAQGAPPNVDQTGPSSVAQDSEPEDTNTSVATEPPPQPQDTGYVPVYTPEDTGVSAPIVTSQSYYYGGYPYPYLWGGYPYPGWYGPGVVISGGYVYGRACGRGVVVSVRTSCPRGYGRGRYVAIPRAAPRPFLPRMRWRPAPPAVYRAPRVVRPAPRPAPRQAPPPSAQRGQSAPLRH